MSILLTMSCRTLNTVLDKSQTVIKLGASAALFRYYGPIGLARI